MIVKLKDILEAREGLLALGNQKLPLKLSYDIAKIMRIGNKEIESLNERRQMIIKQYSPDGTEMTTELNDMIMNKLNSELDREIDIPVHPIDLSNRPSLEMSPRDVIALESFCIFEQKASET